MVFLPPNTDIPRLNAYILPSFPLEELDSFKRTFEFGTCAPFAPMLELVLQHAPEDWAGKTFEYMRSKENEAGRKGPFVVLDERTSGDNGAVWYLESFATEEDVEYGLAESTDVVWRIPIKTECLALAYVNYEIANMSVQEDLGNLDVEMPVAPGYNVERADDCGGLDMREERYSKTAYAVAYPGEYEESTDEEARKNFMPVPDKVARFKEGIAEAAGLAGNRWCYPNPANPRKMPDGSLKEFPEGSVTLAVKYNPDFDWPAYKWPEGSL
jgi:hypothetical protein